MATGREALDNLIQSAADWANTNDKDPKVILLPMLMAYDLAKCRRDDLGDLSRKVMKKGIGVFEKDGLLGLKVRIIRKNDAVLDFQ
jgi:hypothetical protein